MILFRIIKVTNNFIKYRGIMYNILLENFNVCFIFIDFLFLVNFF